MHRSSRPLAALASAIFLLPACGDDATTSTTSAAPTVAPTTTAPAITTVRKIVVDTDLASDDIVALSYLVARPGVELLAVTVSGTGEVTCPRGADIARSLLARLGEPAVPVACGQSAPLSGNRVFPAAWRSAADDAYGLELPPGTPPSAEKTAVQLLTEVISAADDPVTLLTLGPLTNVAQAFAAQPALAGQLASVVIMGGAVSVPGNVQPEGSNVTLPVEWNLYIDPAASAAVIRSGAPVVLVALDATDAVPVSADIIDRLAANDRTTATKLVRELLGSQAPPYLWDPLAAIAAAVPDLVPGHTTTIDVTTTGDDAGRTIAVAGGADLILADPPDATAVIDHLLRTLAGLGPDDPLAEPVVAPVVGEGTVSFDGTTCEYRGPTQVKPGEMLITLTPGTVDFAVVVGHLVEGATVDETMAYSAAHPGVQPPMVDSADGVGAPFGGLSRRIEMRAGTNLVTCGVQTGVTWLGGVVTAA